MGPDEPDVTDAPVIVELDHQPVLVPADVEHHPVAANDAGVPVFGLDIRRLPPCSVFCFRPPGFKRLFRVLVFRYRQEFVQGLP